MELNNILVVEDAAFFAKILRNRLESSGPYKVHVASSLAEAQVVMEQLGEDIFISVLDLHLPDSSGDEIVNEARARGIASIVFSAEYNEETRSRVLAKGVIDYVVKQTPDSVDAVCELIDRIRRNKEIEILVVEDDEIMRRYLALLLGLQQYKILEAENGEQALEVLDTNPNVKLVLTDYQMPEMDGYELVRAIRRRWQRTEIAVIGLSAGDSGTPVSARFLKSGANDFITKPFLPEEFYCRITQNVELIEYVAALNAAASTDPLTGLYNRRHFFAVSEQMCAQARRARAAATVAVLDIDHFKKVNDAYGHAAGDAVLKIVAERLQARLRQSDLLARFGGEEFVVLTTDVTKEQIPLLFEALRAEVAREPVKADGHVIPVTISIGVASGPAENLEALISRADERLYAAKESGRNQVVMTAA